MLNIRYNYSPIYGFMEEKSIKQDIMYEKKIGVVFLQKIKIFYEYKFSKILGIECEYINTLTGEKIISHSIYDESPNKNNNNIKIKVLELKNNDYINKIYLNFDFELERGFIYLKLITKNGKFIELGENKRNLLQIIEINNSAQPQMVSSFYTIYTNYELSGLGFYYLSRKYFILINMLDILRLKHIFNIDEEERKKWENPDEIKKLSLEMQAIVKLCNLENNLFNRIIQYYFPY